MSQKYSDWAKALRRGTVSLLGLVLWTAVGANAAPTTLAIADLPLFSTALIAEAEGYYAAEGLDLKVIHCVNGKRCLKHLMDGEARYATVADTPIMLASLTGAKFDILATIASTNRENRLIGRVDHGIKSAADLKGKRIGVIKGTTVHYFTDALLSFHGVAPSQVTLVGLDGADPSGPLERGEVDAAGLFPPAGPKALKALGSNATVIPDPKIFTITANLVGISAAAGASDEEVMKLLRALKRADQLIDAEPVRARAIIAARLKLDPVFVASVWGDYDFRLSLAQTLITTLEAQARWAIRESLVVSGKMPDYLDYVRIAPLKTLDRGAVSIIK